MTNKKYAETPIWGRLPLPGGNPHLPFPAPCSPAYPPKPGICPSPCCPGVADAPCLPTSPGGDHPAPGPNFHAPAPHPTLGPGAPVQSAAAHHFPAQYQALQMPPCYIYQCTCSNRCLCICPFINRECISLFIFLWAHFI